MTRNIISSIKKVVEKIQAVVNTPENYTIDGDETCKHWLKYLNLDKRIRLFPDFYSAWLTYENENYLVLVNCGFLSQVPSFLQEETLNSGAWVFIIDDLDLSINKDPDTSILEEILDNEWKTEKTRNGEEFKSLNIEEEINGYTLKDFFPKIYLYKIISKFTQKEELCQITGIVLTGTNSYCLLPYSSKMLQEFKNTFESGNQYIPFENILASYVASDFKFAYLDLYRCIERLQPLYFLKPFYDKLALVNKSLEDFYRDFSDHTNLPPRFDDSLKKLLESIEIDYQYEYPNKQNKQNNLDNLINQIKEFRMDFDENLKLEPKCEEFLNNLVALIESIDNNTNKKNKIPSSYLNKLRNEIVHLRPKQTNDLIPKSIDEWNLLMLDMLTIVQELYKTNQNLLT